MFPNAPEPVPNEDQPALAVACDDCGASVGEPCQADGEVIADVEDHWTFHLSRTAKYLDQ
jgi:hypothetical protein